MAWKFKMKLSDATHCLLVCDKNGQGHGRQMIESSGVKRRSHQHILHGRPFCNSNTIIIIVIIIIITSFCYHIYYIFLVILLLFLYKGFEFFSYFLIFT